jgi:prepilin-type N-terminal cleavage/methylation domain-containing protein
MKSLFNKVFRGQDGFTLTELAVVMLIVGILAGVAIPSFLGARNAAYDKEAQASVDVVLNAARVHYAQYGDFSEAQSEDCEGSSDMAASLQALEPGVDIINEATSSSSPRTVSIISADTFNSNNENLGCQAIYAMALSRSGTCWIGRMTVEGSYFLAGSLSPIEVQGDMNTANSSQTNISDLPVNGLAYASFKPQTPNAGVEADALASLADSKTACKGELQGTGSITATVNVVMTDEYYDAWNNVIGAVHTAGTVPT